MWCYIKKRIDILKPKLLVTHPHPEEFINSFLSFKAQRYYFILNINFLAFLLAFLTPIFYLLFEFLFLKQEIRYWILRFRI